MALKLFIGLLLLATAYANISKALIESEGACTLDQSSDINLRRCHSDFVCGGNMKCCGLKEMLGLRVCKIPYFPRLPDFLYDECPYQHQQKEGYGCSDDSVCRADQRCCPNIDGYTVCKTVYRK